jgi:hypothetical protein
MESLVNLGMKAEDVASLLNSLGYSATYSTKRVILYDGNMYEASGANKKAVLADAAKSGKSFQYANVMTAVATKTGSGSSFGGSSGGGGGGDDKWENPYDKLHNVLEEINDLMRERTRLEREF